MKKQSQDQTNEQLHIDDAAAAQEEYSLEDIMNEFGGWSKKEEAAPEKPVQTPPDPQKPPQKEFCQLKKVLLQSLSNLVLQYLHQRNDPEIPLKSL